MTRSREILLPALFSPAVSRQRYPLWSSTLPRTTPSRQQAMAATKGQVRLTLVYLDAETDKEKCPWIKL